MLLSKATYNKYLYIFQKKEKQYITGVKMFLQTNAKHLQSLG